MKQLVLTVVLLTSCATPAPTPLKISATNALVSVGFYAVCGAKQFNEALQKYPPGAVTLEFAKGIPTAFVVATVDTVKAAGFAPINIATTEQGWTLYPPGTEPATCGAQSFVPAKEPSNSAR